MCDKNEQNNINSLLEELNENYVEECYASREDFSVLKISKITLIFGTLLVYGDLIKVFSNNTVPLFDNDFHLEIPVKGIETIEDFNKALYDKKGFMLTDYNLFKVCEDKFEDFKYELRNFIRDKVRISSFENFLIYG